MRGGCGRGKCVHYHSKKFSKTIGSSISKFFDNSKINALDLFGITNEGINFTVVMVCKWKFGGFLDNLIKHGGTRI